MSKSYIAAITLIALVTLILTGPNVFADGHKHKNQKNSPKIECGIKSKIDHHSNNNVIGNRQDCVNNSPNIIDSAINGFSGNNSGDFTSPTVASTDPKDNDNNVPVDTQITVTFSEKMDKNSIDTGSLSLVPDVGNSASISKVSVSGKSATFTVSSNLIPNMNYLATISSNAQDTSGNFLDCSGSSGVDSLCQWNFDTGTSSSAPTITLSPTSGPTGTVVNIAGIGFDPNSKVTIEFDSNSVTTTPATVNTGSDGGFSASFTVPSSSTGDHSVKASQGSHSATKTFTVNSGEASITVSPTSGTVGSPFTVAGTGFDPNTDVTIDFDGSTGTKKSDGNGDFTVTFGVPGSTAGIHIVKASEGSKSASKPFTVFSSIALNPTSGPVGTSVNVTGNGFNSTSTVNLKFDSTPLSPATTDNEGSFSSAFTVPESVNGPHNVTATEGSNTASQSFTVTSKSSIKALGNGNSIEKTNLDIPSNLFG